MLINPCLIIYIHCCELCNANHTSPCLYLEVVRTSKKKILLGGSGCTKKLHVVAWHNIWKLKNQGGLGLKQIKDVNIFPYLDWYSICWWIETSSGPKFCGENMVTLETMICANGEGYFPLLEEFGDGIPNLVAAFSLECRRCQVCSVLVRSLDWWGFTEGRLLTWDHQGRRSLAFYDGLPVQVRYLGPYLAGWPPPKCGLRAHELFQRAAWRESIHHASLLKGMRSSLPDQRTELP